MKHVGSVLLVVLLAFVTAFALVLHNHSKISVSQDLTLPLLMQDGQQFSTSSIREKGKAYLINVFSSWCTTCQKEHEVWMAVRNEGKVDIYGIDYLDVKHKAVEWLNKHGDPYTAVAADYSGESSKKLGVTGVPETFVFDKNGKMIAHIVGRVTMEMWQTKIRHLIQ